MASPRPEHAHATDSPATATFPPRPAHTTFGWLQDRLPFANGPSTAALQQRCHSTSASARSPSWPPMPGPRLQRAAHHTLNGKALYCADYPRTLIRFCSEWWAETGMESGDSLHNTDSLAVQSMVMRSLHPSLSLALLRLLQSWCVTGLWTVA